MFPKAVRTDTIQVPKLLWPAAYAWLSVFPAGARRIGPAQGIGLTSGKAFATLPSRAGLGY